MGDMVLACNTCGALTDYFDPLLKVDTGYDVFISNPPCHHSHHNFVVCQNRLEYWTDNEDGL